MSFDYHLALAGLIVGFCVGLTGMGGGALMTPVLVLGFGITPSAGCKNDRKWATDRALRAVRLTHIAETTILRADDHRQVVANLDRLRRAELLAEAAAGAAPPIDQRQG